MNLALVRALPRFHVVVALVAACVMVADELTKSIARSSVTQCYRPPAASCDRLDLLGSVWMVRVANAGSPMGYAQGLILWVALAGLGVLLIALYARRLMAAGRIAAVGVGLQIGGGVTNLLDRLAFGGATDILYVGWGPVWNLADLALVAGAALATVALATTAGRAQIV